MVCVDLAASSAGTRGMKERQRAEWRPVLLVQQLAAAVVFHPVAEAAVLLAGEYWTLRQCFLYPFACFD